MVRIVHKAIRLDNNKVLLFFTVLICISSLDGLFDGIRYLKYIVGPLAILMWASKGFKPPKHRATVVYCFVFYIAWSIISTLWGDLTQGGKDIVFIASYTMPLFLFYTKEIKIDSVFWIYVSFFFISTLGQEVGSFSIVESRAFLESANSFVFGAFLLAFIMRKKYPLAILALILMLITMKRIAILGVLLCLVIWCCPPKIRSALSSAPALLVFNFSAVLLVILLTSGMFNELIQDLSGKGVHELTLGRTFHYIGVVIDIFQNPQNLVFGNGTGSAYSKAILDLSNATIPNLHSDTLKIFYEGGVICFLLFFYFIGKSESVESRILTLYTAVLFITDNVLIYSGTMFFILLLIVMFNRLDAKEARVL